MYSDKAFMIDGFRKATNNCRLFMEGRTLSVIHD